MKKMILIMVVLFSIHNVYAFDALWQKAQELAENSWTLVPGLTTMHHKMNIGRRAQAGAEFEIVFSRSLGEDNQIAVELVSANYILIEPDGDFDEDDDFEIDPYELEAFEKEFGTIEIDESTIISSNDLDYDHGFDELIQKMVDQEIERGAIVPKREGVFFETNTRLLRVRRLNEQSEINGRMAQAFDIRYSTSGRRRDRVDGEVWLCIETGAPVLTVFSPARTPMFVRNISFRTYYDFLSDSNQFIAVHGAITTSASILGMRASLVVSMTYEEHWEFEF
jgi:hypothetical protein